MADDLFGDAPPVPSTEKTEEAAKATEKLTDSFEDQRDSLRALGQAITPANENLKNFRKRQEEAEQTAKTLSSALDEQIKKFGQLWKETFNNHRELRELSGIASDLTRRLGTLTKFTSFYNERLKEVREGQAALTQSMAATSAGGVKLQKVIDDIRKSEVDAVDLAAKYSDTLGEMEKAQKLVVKQFTTQLQSYENSREKIAMLTETTFVLAKSMGVDLGKATQLMDQRMQTSRKGLLEARQETIRIAGAVDEYVQALGRMEGGLGRARQKKQQFLQTLMEANKLFSHGVFQGDAYANMMKNLNVNITDKFALNPEQTKHATKAVGQLLSKLTDPKLSDIFGIQEGMQLLQSGEIEAMASKQGAARLRKLMKTSEFQQEAPVMQLQTAMQALRGDPQFMANVLRRFAGGMNQDLRKQWTAQATAAAGREDQQVALALSSKDTLMKMADDLENQSDLGKDKKKADEKSKNVFERISEGIKKQLSPDSVVHKTAVKIHTTLKRIEKRIQKYFTWFMAAYIGTKALGHIVPALLGRLAPGLAARWGVGAAAGMAPAAGAAPAIGGAAPALAGGVGRTLLAGLGTTAGIVGAGIGGWQIGKRIVDPLLGKQLAKGMSESELRSLGGDVTVSRMAAEGLVSWFGSDSAQRKLEEINQKRTKRRHALSQREIKTYEEYIRVLDKAKKDRKSLTDEERKTLALAYKERQNREARLAMEGIRKQTAESEKIATASIRKAAKGIDPSKFAHIKDPKERKREMMYEVILQSGKSFRSEKLGMQTLRKMLGGKGGAGGDQEFLAALKAQGISREEFMGAAPSLVKQHTMATRVAEGDLSPSEQWRYEQIKSKFSGAGDKWASHHAAQAYSAMLESREKRAQKAAEKMNMGQKITISSGEGVTGGGEPQHPDAVQAMDGTFESGQNVIIYKGQQTMPFTLKIKADPITQGVVHNSVVNGTSGNHVPG